MSVRDRVRVTDVQLLSDGHFKLRRFTFDWRRSDGEWQSQSREVLDRGDGAAILPFNRARRSVILVRQFRYPAYADGHDDLLIEAVAGLLDGDAPETRIREEAEEESGYRLHGVRKVFEAFTSPGGLSERLHCFVGEYDHDMKVGDGGGLRSEGEDIEVLELPFDEAMAMIADGRIVDAKAIMLLQYAALHVFR